MPQPKLLEKYRERLRVKHYSLRTEEAYLHWVRRYIYFHGKRHPQEMGGSEGEAFLSHLATEGRVSPSTQNQALAALLFLSSEASRQRVVLVRPASMTRMWPVTQRASSLAR